MHGKRKHDHLTLGVAQQNAFGLIGSRRRGVHHRKCLMRLAFKEETGKGKGIHANIEKRSACQLRIEEAILHVVFLIAAKILLYEVYPTKIACVNASLQLLVQRHMQNGAGIHELNAIRRSQLTRLGKLGGVERNGLLAKHVLTRRKSLSQIRNVHVMRRCKVEHINVRSGDKVVNGVIYPCHTMFVRKRHCLLMGAVGYAVNVATFRRKRLGHLIGNNAAADNTPAQLRSCK